MAQRKRIIGEIQPIIINKMLGILNSTIAASKEKNTNGFAKDMLRKSVQNYL
jgi:hypothetical protein